jgi:hypothetical protein
MSQRTAGTPSYWRLLVCEPVTDTGLGEQIARLRGVVFDLPPQLYFDFSTLPPAVVLVTELGERRELTVTITPATAELKTWWPRRRRGRNRSSWPRENKRPPFVTRSNA